jgi:hypothetical protein
MFRGNFYTAGFAAGVPQPVFEKPCDIACLVTPSNSYLSFRFLSLGWAARHLPAHCVRRYLLLHLCRSHAEVWKPEQAPEAVVDDVGKCITHRQLFWSRVIDVGVQCHTSGRRRIPARSLQDPPTEDCFAPCQRIHGEVSVQEEGRWTKASAPVKRRLFVPPTPPAASLAQHQKPIPCPRTETEESRTQRTVLSLWDDSNEPATELGLIKPVSRLGCSFSPNPDASREKIISQRTPRRDGIIQFWIFDGKVTSWTTATQN